MNALEIVFTLSGLILLGMWGWFIALAFGTSRLWGLWIICFFPFSPLMFAYRFERKTRKIIYYFLGSLLLFVLVNGYIFATTIDFFDSFENKIRKVFPKIEHSVAVAPAAKVKKLNLPKPTPIPPPRPIVPDESEEDESENNTQSGFRAKATHHYRAVDLGSLQNYVGKEVVVTTAIVEHRGKLKSVSASQIEIKKSIDGGTTVMGVQKSKIEKAEVFL
jgi:hypothetical protein